MSGFAKFSLLLVAASLWLLASTAQAQFCDGNVDCPGTCCGLNFTCGGLISYCGVQCRPSLGQCWGPGRWAQYNRNGVASSGQANEFLVADIQTHPVTGKVYAAGTFRVTANKTHPAFASASTTGVLQCGGETMYPNQVYAWVVRLDATTGLAESLWCISRRDQPIAFFGLGLFNETSPGPIIRVLIDYKTVGPSADPMVYLRSSFNTEFAWYGYDVPPPGSQQNWMEIRWVDLPNNGTNLGWVASEDFSPIGSNLIPSKFFIRGDRAYYAGYWESSSIQFKGQITNRAYARGTAAPDAPGARDAFFAVFQVTNFGLGALLYQGSLLSMYTAAASSRVEFFAMDVHPGLNQLTTCVTTNGPTVEIQEATNTSIPKVNLDTNTEILCVRRDADTFELIPGAILRHAVLNDPLTGQAAAYTADVKFHIAFTQFNIDQAVLVTYPGVNNASVAGTQYVVTNQSVIWTSMAAVKSSATSLAVMAQFQTSFHGSNDNPLLSPLQLTGAKGGVLLYFDKQASGGAWKPYHAKPFLTPEATGIVTPTVVYSLDNTDRTVFVGGWYQDGQLPFAQAAGDPDFNFPAPTPNVKATYMLRFDLEALTTVEPPRAPLPSSPPPLPHSPSLTAAAPPTNAPVLPPTSGPEPLNPLGPVPPTAAPTNGTDPVFFFFGREWSQLELGLLCGGVGLFLVIVVIIICVAALRRSGRNRAKDSPRPRHGTQKGGPVLDMGAPQRLGEPASPRKSKLTADDDQPAHIIPAAGAAPNNPGPPDQPLATGSPAPAGAATAVPAAVATSTPSRRQRRQKSNAQKSADDLRVEMAEVEPEPQPDSDSEVSSSSAPLARNSKPQLAESESEGAPAESEHAPAQPETDSDPQGSGEGSNSGSDSGSKSFDPAAKLRELDGSD